MTAAAPFRLTPVRIAWLRRLEREGFAHRDRGRTGYDCMHAGLTTWLYRRKRDGRHFCAAEVQLERNTGAAWDDFENIGETLTEEGRRQLTNEGGRYDRSQAQPAPG